MSPLIRKFGVLLSIITLSLTSVLRHSDADSKKNAFATVLTEASGSYQLTKGGENCPDGSFTYTEGSFIVGANLRIDHINEGEKSYPASDQSACDFSSQAEFSEGKLVYQRQERCQRSVITKGQYALSFRRQRSKRFIELAYTGKVQFFEEEPQEIQFKCVYEGEAGG